MPDMTLGPFPLGLDNQSPATHRPAGTLFEAHNVLVQRNGEVHKRFGRRRVLVKPGVHSGWTSRATGMSLVVDNGVLSRARWTNGLQLTLIAAVGTAPMSYCDLNGEVLCTNGSGLWRVTKAGVTATLQPFTLPKPSLTVTAGGSGGLDEGSYAVTVTFVTATGEESAAARLSFADVADGGGLQVAVSWPADGRITAARVYRSGANGAEVYRAAEIPAGMGSYLVGSGTLGVQCKTLHMRPLPAGSLIRHWRGRVLVAAGSVLCFSESLRYGVFDPKHHFVQFPSAIGVVQPVESGVYVGCEAGVFFLQGDGPGQWRYVRRGSGLPVAGSGTEIPSTEFSGELGDLDLPLALWRSDQGLAIGLPDGRVEEPQSGRLALARPARAALGWFGRRVWLADQ
jgi:hypothetical protein